MLYWPVVGWASGVLMRRCTGSVVELIRAYVDEGYSFRVIAEKLGLSYDYVRELASKHGIYRYGPRKKSHRTVGSSERCPECGGTPVDVDGELVCSNCGLVLDELNMIHRLPMDETYAPTCDLAFGRSLGSTLQGRALHKVLAMAPAGKKDLGLRARHIRIIESKVEPSYIRRLLEYGSKLFKQLGLDEDTPVNHQLANLYGRLLRIVGAFIHVAHLERKHPASRIAKATLHYLLSRHRNLEDLGVDLKFKPKDLKLVQKLSDLLD